MITRNPRGNSLISMIRIIALASGSSCQKSFEVFSEVALSRYTLPNSASFSPNSPPVPFGAISSGSETNEWRKSQPYYHVSVFLGSGYNIFDADPGTASLDTGINTVYAKVLQKTYLPVHFQSGCPEEALCTQFAQANANPTSTVSPVTAVIRSSEEYRNHLARNLRIVGPSSFKISEVIGSTNQMSDTISDDLDDGDVLLEKRRSVVLENVVFNYRTHKTLTTNFVAAVCELPLHYDYDLYSGLFMEFGTHVIVGVQAGEIALERTMLRRHLIAECNLALQHIVAIHNRHILNLLATPEAPALANEIAKKSCTEAAFPKTFMREYLEGKPKECPALPPRSHLSSALLSAAYSKLPPNATSYSSRESPSAPHPLSFVLREISELFTPDHFNDSELVCDHLQAPETVTKLRRNVKTALMEAGLKYNSTTREKKPRAILQTGCTPTNYRSTEAIAVHVPGAIPAHIHNQKACANDSCGWPDGQYGLLRVRDQSGGCPAGDIWTTWNTGKRFHKVQSGFVGSAEMFIDVGYLSSYNEIYLSFCMKKTNQFPTITTATTNNAEATVQWEQGAYCLLRSRRGPCPENFYSGTYFLNDIRTPANAENGELPEGESYQCHDEREEPHFCGTIYKFCCRNDGDPEVPIRLPVSRPFVLFAKTMVCQEVIAMRTRHLWLPVFSETNTVQQVYGDNLPYITAHNSIPNLVYWHLCHYSRA